MVWGSMVYGCFSGFRCTSYHDVAGQQGTELRFPGDPALGQLRVAGAEDDVVTNVISSLLAKLLGEGGTDIYLGEDTEALLRECFAGAFDGVLPGEAGGDGVRVGHEILLIV